MFRVYLETSGNKPLIFGGGSPDGNPSEDLSGVQLVNGTRPGNTAVVDRAKSQVGNVGGQPYWSWYGFNSRVEWCACFVSWCYNQAGKSEPRFAACQSQGIPWFQSHGQWGDRNYPNIAPGDAIFFDWDGDGSADHVGLVIGTDGQRVYTVEGNSGDACKIGDGRDYDALYASALCRAKADWIIGINATRLFSCLYHKTLNVGRVQTPTLKMLVDRGEAISHFKKEKYYHVRLDLSGAEAASERISDKSRADALKAACEAGTAVCVSLTKEKKTAAPPKLFDLTSLQREANKIYGYTAKQTLDLAQTLYEKRLLTYPRTDSAFLTDDMGDTAAKTVAMLSGKLPFMEGAEFTPEVSRTLDSSKVSDHHAIIPTMELAKTDLAALPESERNILTLAGARLIFAAAEPHIFEAVTAVFSCAGTEFTARGKTVLAGGWKELERRYRATLKGKPDPEDMEEENTLPELSEGQTFTSPTAKVTEHFTTPPKPHSEATLLSAMERAGNGDTDPDAERRGLGTPATRAAVIEKLVKSGFAERKGKQLIPTQNGAALVSVLPDIYQV